uniref:L27 domain-containing protein n=1 Tax=Macrostomum lignano TaxID=282301 RepID=A0A1I8FCW2_9PLAT
IYGLARRVSDAGGVVNCLPGDDRDDRERIELLRLLNEPHLVALMKVHDGAAARAVPLEDHLPGVAAPTRRRQQSRPITRHHHRLKSQIRRRIHLTHLNAALISPKLSISSWKSSNQTTVWQLRHC